MVAKILISTSVQIRRDSISEFLKQFKVKKEHPDVLYIADGEKLGVEQAKKIRDFLSTKPYQAEGKVVVLEDGSVLTHEAQNSLLKTLEELPERTLFILGAKSESNFLPTVLSRCEIVMLEGAAGAQNEVVEKLINSTLEERFAYIEKLKDRDQFLKELIRYFHQNLPTDIHFLKELLEAEKWAASNVNPRAILEYLMMVIPS